MTTGRGRSLVLALAALAPAARAADLDPGLPPFTAAVVDGRGLRLALEASTVPDVGGAPASRVGVSLEWGAGPAELWAAFLATRSQLPGSDELDVGATIGAGVPLGRGLRLGAALQVSDLEEIVDPGIEGGTSAYVGPTLGWSCGDRVQILAGPALGLAPGAHTVHPVARVAASARF